MSKRIRRDGRYSGRPLDGAKEWPEVLVGSQEIGAYLRIHPDTAKKMLEDGRLPGMKDGRGRWMTTRRLLDRWILEAMVIRAESKPLIGPRNLNPNVEPDGRETG